ncbi:NADP-dependent oxidoreductase [Pseudonocardia phyllosphaerae]|uniref:NADP-dependent oxidoreductase n=1 Tax=Pseudonocardia phyllosphaerae TaxID=3390502 RepID=UPI00397DD4B7
MGNEINHQVRLAARPAGTPAPEVWQHVTGPVPEPGPGRFIVRVSHLSLDPAMRGWINEGGSYAPPVELGSVMRALGLGRVVASEHPDYAVGDTVTGFVGVQDYVETDGTGLRKVTPAEGVPTERYLALLGMTGLTAYFGLFDVGAVAEGDTVVVSGAAGAVGSVVGQLARIAGARVIGIAGGPEKTGWVTGELGFDAAIDYRSEDVSARLAELAPDGVNVYFDNVGGEILEAVLDRLAMHARIVLCGAISQYNAEGGMAGPRNYMNLLVYRSRMEGFLVGDYAARWGEAVEKLAGWLAEGRLHSREDVVDGTVDDFPETFLRLFRGENTGKLVLRLRSE